MTIWMIWVQCDGATWLQGAWDDDSTSGNPDGWRAEVDRVRKLCREEGYEYRIQKVTVPCVFELFEPGAAVARWEP